MLVFGAEIVPPLADAMRFVYGEKADGLLIEKTQETVGNEPLRCDVEQFQTTLGEFVRHLAGFFHRCTAVDRCCFYACGVQARHLVIHQGDQRRNDDGDTFAHQRGNLVTQRLAPTRRHQYQQASAACQCIDDSLLLAAKFGIAEYFVQNLLGGRLGHDDSVGREKRYFSGFRHCLHGGYLSYPHGVV
ncbi:hypothetical protein NEISICOT_00428 [Neisseria sicca ATCC 29256]|uniref:Uncharacterized protein n=1 Tax=Neisseria sicca ATCC 29256 TaxID=547045 RepID=C6M1P3_NEISI|nr:hypothetical protein NEISICOT_00428 [Neisseria sicca ATCC 29256]